MLVNNCTECSLDDVLEFRNGKALSNTLYKEEAKYPVWGSNGIIAHSDEPLNTESVIVIGRVGAFCGSLNLVMGANWVTDNAIYAVPKPVNDIKFLYYLLISLDIPHTAIGSAQPLLTQSGLKVIKCKVPPLETQKEIAHILGTLDDKIELNRKMNKTLEEIAQALFKHWFIDFEFPNSEGKPYKSSGGAMTDSELGLIPQGWKVEHIEAIIKREPVKRKLKKDDVQTDGKYPVYDQSATGLLGFINDPEFNCSIETPYVIFGDHTCTLNLCTQPFSLSENIIPLKGKNVETAWLYYAIKGKQKFEEYRRHWMELLIKKITIPSKEIMKRFLEAINSIECIANKNIDQNRDLYNIREILSNRFIGGLLE